jgi:hypothetical protein
MTVYDREVLPVQILSQVMGWPDVERVWMPEWLRAEDTVIDRLVRAVRTAADSTVPADCATETPSSMGPGQEDAPVHDVRIGERTSGAGAGDTVTLQRYATGPGAAVKEAPVVGTDDVAGPPLVEEEVELPAVASRPLADDGEPRVRVPVLSRMERFHNQAASEEGQSWDLTSVTEFRPWTPHVMGTRSVLDMADTDREARELVHEVAREICAAEHPIEQRRFRVFVCNAFELMRMKSSREEWLKAVLRRSGLVTDRWGFVWPSDLDQSAMIGYRRFALDTVAIEEIHPRELDNLMRTVVAELPDGTRDEEILRAAFEELGRGRHKLVARVRTALEASLVRVTRTA